MDLNDWKGAGHREERLEDLEPDEAAALALGARFWQQASLAGAASGALMKLRAAGVDTGDVSRTGVEVHITSTEPAFAAVWDAVQQRRGLTADAAGMSKTEKVLMDLLRGPNHVQ